MKHGQGRITLQGREQSGFTLVEVLIALTIFALLAVITAAGLRTVVHTSKRVSAVNERLRQIFLATTIIRRDFSQLIDRPAKDKHGVKLPSLDVLNKSTLEFTRAGYTNPIGRLTRSSLQRVTYTFKEHALVRQYWPKLDHSPHAKQRQQVVLTGIKSFYLSYVKLGGEVADVWSTKTEQRQKFPQAVILTMRLDKLGQLKLIIPIRGRGYAND